MLFFLISWQRFIIKIRTVHTNFETCISINSSVKFHTEEMYEFQYGLSYWNKDCILAVSHQSMLSTQEAFARSFWNSSVRVSVVHSGARATPPFDWWYGSLMKMKLIFICNVQWLRRLLSFSQKKSAGQLSLVFCDTSLTVYVIDPCPKWFGSIEIPLLLLFATHLIVSILSGAVWGTSMKNIKRAFRSI